MITTTVPLATRSQSLPEPVRGEAMVTSRDLIGSFHRGGQYEDLRCQKEKGLSLAEGADWFWSFGSKTAVGG